MITPSYGLTATERVLPSFVLDWTTGLVQSTVDVTRAGVATFVGSNGLIQSATADTQRIDYSTGTAGLLVEESGTNVLLNSLIDGTSLATQSVTVTAATTTLSFYGTGTVVLSGAHSATVVGAGAYPTRTTLTFIPSAGVLTLTITGTVQFAQLEAGALSTSFIPTEATAVTRNADSPVVDGTNFSDFFNATEGTFVFEGSLYAFQAGKAHLTLRSDTSNFMRIRTAPSGSISVRFEVTDGGVSQVALTPSTINVSDFAEVFAYKENDFAVAVGRGTVLTDTSATVPTVDEMFIGRTVAGVTQYNGLVRKILYYPQRLINAEIQAFSK
jgi:hypothetical protein